MTEIEIDKDILETAKSLTDRTDRDFLVSEVARLIQEERNRCASVVIRHCWDQEDVTGLLEITMPDQYPS